MEIKQYLTQVRRDLHQIPELFHTEFLTQKYIVNQLNELGISYSTFKTGVIADIQGKNNKITLGFRADIDALPIHEQNEVEYKSKHEGCMHACGHDGHTAMLLGLAKYYSTKKPEVNLRLIFQPAEENEGGAEMLIEHGALDGVDAIFGLHLSPEHEKGVIATDEGAIFAGAYDFHVVFEGVSGHCADYHKYTDALKASVIFYSEAYKLFEENFSSNHIFHIGKMSGGDASNIVAKNSQCDCTFRFFDENSCKEFMAQIEDILTKTKHKTNANYNLVIENYYPPLINDAKIVNQLKQKLNVQIAKPKYTAEDFAYYLKKVPGAYAWLGIKDEKHTAPLHSCYFDFDESVLWVGVEYYIKLIQNIVINA